MSLDLYALRERLGGDVIDGGARWLGPGPGHSPRDRSLSVLISPDGRPLVHSFAGDNFTTCADYLGIKNAAPARVDRVEHDRLKWARHAETARRENAAMAFCERVWSGCQPVEGSPAERYLDARAIDWIPADLGFHARAPRGYATQATAPALVALARSVTGAPKALQVTMLTADGTGKTGRLTFGAILGAAVRLAAADAVLAVGEGLETCASFAKLEGVATWATLGTANLEAFRPPSCVRHLIIAADGDAPGLKAANVLAERLRSRCDVTIMPAPAGADWNDVAMGKANV